MTTKSIIPNRLREHRKHAELRQLDVAKALGLGSTDRISRWEKGLTFPHVVNLFKLARLYDVAPQELYRELFDSVGTSSVDPEAPDTFRPSLEEALDRK